MILFNLVLTLLYAYSAYSLHALEMSTGSFREVSYIVLCCMIRFKQIALQTRSTWASYTRKITPSPSAPNFDFPRLVAAAIDRERRPERPTDTSSISPPSSPLTSPELDPVMDNSPTNFADEPPPLSLTPESLPPTLFRVNPASFAGIFSAPLRSPGLTNAQRKKLNVHTFFNLLCTPH